MSEISALLLCLQTVPLFIKQAFFDRFDFCGLDIAHLLDTIHWETGERTQCEMLGVEPA
jgi:hypothetical protein